MTFTQPKRGPAPVLNHRRTNQWPPQPPNPHQKVQNWLKGLPNIPDGPNMIEPQAAYYGQGRPPVPYPVRTHNSQPQGSMGPQIFKPIPPPIPASHLMHQQHVGRSFQRVYDPVSSAVGYQGQGSGSGSPVPSIVPLPRKAANMDIPIHSIEVLPPYPRLPDHGPRRMGSQSHLLCPPISRKIGSGRSSWPMVAGHTGSADGSSPEE
ncbi:hypothetical protein BJ875DRAFT_497665 [Amylocarpus encephaloides]|uniref:Uncharacterized protein n=1 Tax=Amylocarpus encephaloides TaxID=45428 RepID=A0A9P8C386_9HELO|nr:hypothetical protein BJ875DRAFT_497665 [Amylocarpus encephaloides]